MNIFLKIKDILIALVATIAAAFGVYNLGRKSKENELKLDNEKTINEKLRQSIIEERKINNLSNDELNNRLRKREDLY